MIALDCPACGSRIDVQPAGRPNVRAQVLEHLSACTGALPPAEQVDHVTELAMRAISHPPEQCGACDDICTIHGEDDNIAFCSDLE
jgi:hypothetical protein